jgi:hypothetical protein
MPASHPGIRICQKSRTSTPSNDTREMHSVPSAQSVVNGAGLRANLRRLKREILAKEVNPDRKSLVLQDFWGLGVGLQTPPYIN